MKVFYKRPFSYVCLQNRGILKTVACFTYVYRTHCYWAAINVIPGVFMI